jgi:selenocysteine lyase/cysteine desulfurase
LGGHVNIEDREEVELLVLQVIKTALTIQLKSRWELDNIMKREHEIVAYIFSELGAVSNIF